MGLKEVFVSAALILLMSCAGNAGADGLAINWNLDFDVFGSAGSPLIVPRSTDQPRDLRAGSAAETSYVTVRDWGELGAQLASGTNTGLQVLQQLQGTWEALSELDAELASRQQDDGSGPEIPSSCAGGEDASACGECFATAYGELNFTRLTLERLRTIHRRTITYIVRSEGLGDSLSGFHSMSGLSWQYAKIGVEQERARFNQASRQKYGALMRNMRRSLDMVAECEAKHFDNPDWYNRYGFMYFNFVQEAYAIGE